MKRTSGLLAAVSLLISVSALCSCTFIRIDFTPGSAAETESPGAVTPLPESESETETCFPYIPADAAENIEDPYGRAAAEQIDGAVNFGIRMLNKYKGRKNTEIYGYTDADFPKAYERLNGRQKEIYDIIYAAVSNYGDYRFDEKEMSGNAFGDITDAEYAVFEDYPITSMYYRDVSEGPIHTPMYFLPNGKSPADSIDEVDRCKKEYLAVFDRILSCAPKNADNCEKCLYFTAVLSAACDYDKDLETKFDPFQAYNAIMGKKAICRGYAQAFCLLCRAAGIYCKCIEGHAGAYGEEPDRNHMWNAVMTPDGWRFIDVTWTDGSQSGEDISLAYFLMDEDALDFNGYVPDFDTLK